MHKSFILTVIQIKCNPKKNNYKNKHKHNNKQLKRQAAKPQDNGKKEVKRVEGGRNE